MQQAELTTSLVAPVRNDSIEIDELFIRFGKKRQYRYLWVAVCRLSRQVIAYFVGDRSKESLKQLWKRVPKAYRKKLVYTDEYNVYGAFFRPWQHRPSPKGSGRTNLAEGMNNKWRNRVPGLVRRTACVQHLTDVDDRLLLVLDQHNKSERKRLEKLGWAKPLPTH